MEEIGIYDLPYEVVEKSPGFSMDMGGSVIKLTYRAKEDWEEAQKSKDKKYAKVRMVSFARTDLTQALDFMEKNVEISRKDENDVPVVYCTGVGCNMHKDDINKRMKVDVQLLTEFDCFVKAFIFLSKTLPKEAILYELPKDGVEKAQAATDRMIGAVAKMEKFSDMKMDEKPAPAEVKEEVKKTTTADSNTPLAEAESIFPCLLAMCGSGFGYMKIEADGKFSVIDGSNRGGRMFLGLGTILSGAQSFGELMELAEKGNNRNVDMYTNDLVESKGENVYSLMSEFDTVVYCFGKGVKSKPGQFKKEDLVKTLLHSMALDTAAGVFLSAAYSEVNRIFFCGSFLNHPLIRSMMTEKLMERILGEKIFLNVEVEKKMDFIKGGSHLGSLGAFMHIGTQGDSAKEATGNAESEKQEAAKE